MKEILKLMFALTLISSAAGLLLGYTNRVTTEPIASARQKETTEALKAVLTEFDNDPARNVCQYDQDGRSWSFHVARKNGKFTGVAFETSSAKGYGGDIVIMVGITAAGTVKNIRILSQHETPGLGTKVAEIPFKSQFVDRPIEGTVWAVKKDKGDFDAVTGATISSRAVLEALREGLEFYRSHQAEIIRTGE